MKRIAGRGVYDRAAVYEILDEALVCHVGIVTDDQPYVIPMLHARIDDELFIHGSPGSRLIQQAAAGSPACLTATLLDGLVLARSAFHHSLNYRSVVVLARGREIRDRDEKWTIMERLVERVIPGRWAHIRQPNEKEFNGTTLVAFPLDECSAKVRTGPPKDDDEDYELPIWAGVIPLALRPGLPQPDPRLPHDVPPPSHVANYRR